VRGQSWPKGERSRKRSRAQERKSAIMISDFDCIRNVYITKARIFLFSKAPVMHNVDQLVYLCVHREYKDGT